MIARRLAALPDRALWLAIGGALFALSAWPLLLVELPPFQDLPNHVASAYIARHLDVYPAYAFNGLWKANSALELWLQLLRARQADQRAAGAGELPRRIAAGDLAIWARGGSGDLAAGSRPANSAP